MPSSLPAFHNETLELDAHISGAGAGHAALTEDAAVGESEAAVASDTLGIALDGGAAVAQHPGVLSGHGEPADGIEADALIGAVTCPPVAVTVAPFLTMISSPANTP